MEYMAYPTDSISAHVEAEIGQADELLRGGDGEAAFRHLERAHVLGQASTFHHTRVHFLMLKLALKAFSPREIFGQIFRIVGAATKTPFGIYPTGNTGGSDVWFFKPMPVPDDLRAILDRSNAKS